MMHPQDLSQPARKLFDMIEFDDSESLVCEIRKHPFGLTLIYLGGFGLAAFIILLAITAAALLPSSLEGVSDDVSGAKPFIVIAGLLIGGFAVLITFVAAYIYRRNIIILTTQKITQMLQKSLITRKISQLSIGDVQDVTVHQDDLFARIFHYGTLVIETSGEQANYRFTYVPDPYQAAKHIVATHEDNMKEYGN